MLVTTDRDNLLEKVRDGQHTLRTISSAQLVSQTVSVTTLWLTSVLSSLEDLQKKGTFIAGVGDFRVTQQTMDCIGRVLSSIRQYFLPTPGVSPVSGGGVAISWTLNNEEIEILVFPNNRVLMSKMGEGELTQDPIELAPSEYWKVNLELGSMLAE